MLFPSMLIPRISLLRSDEGGLYLFEDRQQRNLEETTLEIGANEAPRSKAAGGISWFHVH